MKNGLLKKEKINGQKTLEKLRSMGIVLQPIELPNLPIASSCLISWFGEIRAIWDEMIRTGQDAELLRQDSDHIGALCRMTRTIPAIEYIQLSRVRTLVMEEMAKTMTDIDVYVAPYSRNEPSTTLSDLNLQLTNGTGHPSVVLPNGFTNEGVPTGITFVGKLYGEADTLLLALAYQNATGFHLKKTKL